MTEKTLTFKALVEECRTYPMGNNVTAKLRSGRFPGECETPDIRIDLSLTGPGIETQFPLLKKFKVVLTPED